MDRGAEPVVLFEGKRFRVERVVQTTPDGTRHAKEIVRHPGAVAVLPLLGVRTNSLRWPLKASKTARALLRQSPVPVRSIAGK